MSRSLHILDVNPSLDKGRYALQESNGIGKSTLLGILCGSIEPDHGDITIDRSNIRTSPLAIRRKLPYVPGEARVYPLLRGREFFAIGRPRQECES